MISHRTFKVEQLHHTHTHTTLFTKALQIQNIDISVRKEKMYMQTKNK